MLGYTVSLSVFQRHFVRLLAATRSVISCPVERNGARGGCHERTTVSCVAAFRCVSRVGDRALRGRIQKSAPHARHARHLLAVGTDGPARVSLREHGVRRLPVPVPRHRKGDAHRLPEGWCCVRRALRCSGGAPPHQPTDGDGRPVRRARDLRAARSLGNLRVTPLPARADELAQHSFWARSGSLGLSRPLRWRSPSDGSHARPVWARHPESTTSLHDGANVLRHVALRLRWRRR
jgi:hypothetical protein